MSLSDWLASPTSDLQSTLFSALEVPPISKMASTQQTSIAAKQQAHQDIQRKNSEFLQHLKEQGAEVAVPKKRAQLGLSKEELGSLMLKHRMQLMTITSGSSAHFRGLATQAFFEDVLQKTCRLSTKLLIDSQKACSWHLYASNNLSVHLDQQWDLIKKIEKNARDFERMSMQTPA